MNLYKYLLAIKSKKAINLKRFISLLPKQYQGSWRSLFSAVKIAGLGNKDKYQVSVINEAEFEQLLQLTKPSNSREGAANQGDSHTKNTSMSYFLVYPSVSLGSTNSNKQAMETVNCPQPVVCYDSGFTMDFSCQKNLVIIENQENFFRYQEFLPQLLSMHLGFTESSLAKVDIAYGQGNNVTNRLNAEFFAQYQQILCCFDYDLGGLTMFSSLTKLIKTQPLDTGLSLVLPTKNQLNCSHFVKHHFKKWPKETKHWQDAIKLAEQLGFSDLAQAFSLSRKFMEQEVLLTSTEK